MDLSLCNQCRLAQFLAGVACNRAENEPASAASFEDGEPRPIRDGRDRPIPHHLSAGTC